MNLRPKVVCRDCYWGFSVFAAHAAYRSKQDQRNNNCPGQQHAKPPPAPRPAPQPEQQAPQRAPKPQVAQQPQQQAPQRAPRPTPQVAQQPQQQAPQRAPKPTPQVAQQPAQPGGRPTRPRSEARIADGAAALATRDDSGAKTRAPDRAATERCAPRSGARPVQGAARTPGAQSVRQGQERPGRSPGGRAGASGWGHIGTGRSRGSQSVRQGQERHGRSTGGRAGRSTDRRLGRCACRRTGSWASGRSGGRDRRWPSSAAPASNPFAKDGGQKGGRREHRRVPGDGKSSAAAADPAKLAKPQRVRPLPVRATHSHREARRQLRRREAGGGRARRQVPAIQRGVARRRSTSRGPTCRPRRVPTVRRCTRIPIPRPASAPTAAGASRPSRSQA